MIKTTSEIEEKRPNILHYYMLFSGVMDVKAWLIFEMTHMAMYMVENEINRIKIWLF